MSHYSTSGMPSPMGWLVYFFDAMMSLVPSPYRERYGTDHDLYPAALVSGVAQYAVCVVLLFVGYIHAMNAALLRLGAAAIARGGKETLAAGPVLYGAGFVSAGEFLLRPLTLLLIYLALEGLVRLLGAAVTHEVLGTLPLYLGARAWERLRRTVTRDK